MSGEVVVPQLGESVVEATIGRWMKHEGETVEAGEPLAELETDKVNLEVTAPEAGTLSGIRKGEGETVGVGEVLAMIAAASDSAGAPVAPQATPAPAAQPAPQAAYAAAVLESPHVAPNGTPAPNGVHGTMTAPPDATPLALRMAAQEGLDLGAISGTGAGGRITKDDVAAYISKLAASVPVPTRPLPASAPSAPAAPAPVAPAAPTPQAAAPAAPASPAIPAPAAPATPREERVRMSRRRQTIARRLVEAQHTAAMLTTFNEVDMSAILDLRARHKESFKQRHGVGLGFMSFFTKAVVGALKAYPRLNAEIQGDEMVLKRYYDIGIAVSTDEGLVVPVLRDADRLSFAEIERRIADLATRARNRQLGLEDLQGGTFTITNGGVFGSLLSTPILNGPQVGILGMHKIEERPIAKNGQVVIHPMMYLAVSYDHRIVDGAEAVGFLVRVKELLEDAETLLLEG